MLCPTAEDLGPISGQSCLGTCGKWANLAIWGPLHMSVISFKSDSSSAWTAPSAVCPAGAYWEGHAV